MKRTSSTGKQRVLYAKGGRAIEEAARLFSIKATLPPNGPDQFLLAARFAFFDADFRLVSVGPLNLKRIFKSGEALEYSLRPATNALVIRALSQTMGLLCFTISSLRWRPSIVLAGIEGPIAIASLCVAWLLRARFVVLVHTDLRAASLSKPKIWMNQYVVQHADAVVVHGPFLRDQLLKLGCTASRLMEFDTGFDPSLQRDAPKCPTAELGSGAILYAGRIEANKGVFDLLKAFEEMAGLTHARLTFAGDGSDLESLRQQVAASRYASRISVLGPVPHAHLLARMQQALVSVAPTQSSVSEGRCMSALESLLMGTPVIAPELGAFPYLVQHKVNGLLYQPDSIPALAQAMTAIANDADLLSQLRAGAQRSGKALMRPQRTFLDCLIEAAR